ncbi:MAG: hypothetical protein ACQESG_05005 [Nanobdellota archaeon]
MRLVCILCMVFVVACTPLQEPLEADKSKSDAESETNPSKSLDITAVRGYLMDTFYRIEVLVKLQKGSKPVDMKTFTITFNNESFTYPGYKIDFLEGDADDILERNETFMISFDPNPFPPGEQFEMSIDQIAINGTAPNSSKMRPQLWP